MSEKKKVQIKKAAKKVDKYDITVGLDLTFEQAIKQIADRANGNVKAKKVDNS